MVTINKATLSSNVWETFYDRIKTNVTSVTLSDTTTRTVKTVTGSFPDKAVDSDKPTSDYPIIVINTPTISWDGPPSFSLTKKKAMISINIEIYESKSESAELLLDAVNESIETYRNSLKDLGLRFVKQDSTDSDEVFRGKIKLHIRRTTWTMEYIFTATRTY